MFLKEKFENLNNAEAIFQVNQDENRIFCIKWHFQIVKKNENEDSSKKKSR